MKPKFAEKGNCVYNPICQNCKRKLHYIDPNEKPDGTFLMICVKCNLPYSLAIGPSREKWEKKENKRKTEALSIQKAAEAEDLKRKKAAEEKKIKDSHPQQKSKKNK